MKRETTPSSISQRVVVVFLAIAVLSLNSLILFWSLNGLFGTSDAIRRSIYIREVLSEVLFEINAAETGQRGFIITGEPRYLSPYSSAEAVFDGRVAYLRRLIEQEGRATAEVDLLARLARQKFDEMDETIRLAQDDGQAAAIAAIRTDRGKAIMDDIRRQVATMREAEEGTLSIQRATNDRYRLVSVVSLATFIVETIVLILLLLWNSRQEIARKEKAAEQLSRYAEDLDQSMQVLTDERNQIARLNEAATFLQSCNTIDEIAGLIGPFMKGLMPVRAGALYRFAASRNQIKTIALWGDVDAAEVTGPSECWGLRRGQPHMHSPGSSFPRCSHLHAAISDERTICLPLVAQGETIGLLSLVYDDDASLQTEGADRFGDMVAKMLAQTISSISLREGLKEQTIRDPMTNAFNRRYLEVVAEKEMSKCRRYNRPMVVAMVDVDHFKHFNDMHGHQAGDAALIAVCKHLAENLREGDWLFRYGGEEFALLLTELDSPHAHARLDDLRNGIARLSIDIAPGQIATVTISVGFTVYHGGNIRLEELIAEADAALYSAKKEGRNQVAACAAHATDATAEASSSSLSMS
ncbi:sensor domain-containing diguanylate cyclase [Ensifer soli]|uniref:sensor domain-containing diguanylate cyclase n=1 Tax=Ciceribacter sp. sgz301302 TaxID=3342379 RepID=UPI0035B7CE3D